MRKIPPYLLLEAWRGIAALWVVMYHSSQSFLGGNPGFATMPLYVVSSMGWLGVVLFFIISGYCITGAAHSVLLSGRGVGSYACDRIRRIYPPYLAAFVLALVIGGLTSLAQRHQLIPPIHHPGPQFNAFSLFANLLLVQYELKQPSVIVVFWTLCYEVMFYAIIGVFLFTARQVSRRSALPIAIDSILFAGIGVTTLGSLIWMIVSPGTCPFPLDRWYQFGWGGMFFLVVAANSTPEPQRRGGIFCAHRQIFVAGGLILLLASLDPLTPMTSESQIRIEALTCIVFLGIIWLLSPYDAWLARSRLIQPLMRLGIFSYSLYLIHSPILPFVDVGLRQLGLDQNWYWVTYLAQIAVAVLVAWFFYLAVEKHFISSRQKQRVEIELKLDQGVGSK